MDICEYDFDLEREYPSLLEMPFARIDLKLGHKVRFHIKSWYKKNICERAFNAKVMSSGAFVFVLKSLFWKVPKYGDFVEVLKKEIYLIGL